MSYPAGWYQDPQSPGLLRYWNGSAWTEHTSPTAPAQQPGQHSDHQSGQQYGQQYGQHSGQHSGHQYGQHSGHQYGHQYDQSAAGQVFDRSVYGRGGGNPNRKFLFIGAAVVGVLLVAVLGFVLLGGDEPVGPASPEVPANQVDDSSAVVSVEDAIAGACADVAAGVEELREALVTYQQTEFFSMNEQEAIAAWPNGFDDMTGILTITITQTESTSRAIDALLMDPNMSDALRTEITAYRDWLYMHSSATTDALIGINTATNGAEAVGALNAMLETAIPSRPDPSAEMALYLEQVGDCPIYPSGE